MWKQKKLLETIQTTQGNRAWQGACQILEILTNKGFEAYVVGGAVRDLLCHIEPYDYDICTNATPDEVIATLRQAGVQTTDLVGKSFGVIVAFTPKGRYEVATFRGESYGADAHRPDNVWYTDSLAEDVKRRDFTCNGLAMDETGHVYDLVEGMTDIQHKVLRTIGEAETRFREDPLRLFRACRFASQLDMRVHPTLAEGMPAAFERVSGLSFTRVRQEFEKLLLTKTPAKGLDVLVQSGLGDCSCQVVESGQAKAVSVLPELTHLVNLPQEKAFHEFDGWYHTLAAVQAAPADLIIRWGALLHDVGKGMPGVRAVRKGRLTDYGHDAVGADMARALLTRWQYPKEMVERVAWIVQNHMRFHYFASHEEANVRKWVRELAQSGAFRTQADLKEAVRQLTEVCAADVIACGKPHASTDGTYAFGECMEATVAEMPIHTRDLRYTPALIEEVGSHAKDILPYLLRRVQDGQLQNNEIALLEAARKYYERRILKNDTIFIKTNKDDTKMG